MIGPEIPTQLLSGRSTTPDDNDENVAGPSASIGPVIPPEVLVRSQETKLAEDNFKPEEDDESEDDYVPELPPDLAAAHSGPSESAAPPAAIKQVQGPALPPGLRRRRYAGDSDDSDDDYGPMPLPAGMQLEETDGVREFLEKEEQRRKHVEVSFFPFRFLPHVRITQAFVAHIGSCETKSSEA